MSQLKACLLRIPFCLLVVGMFLIPDTVSAQLFKNLEGLGRRLDVGDPEVTSTWREGREGPKGITTADFDGNGESDLAITNLDGTVTLLYNHGGGQWDQALHLKPGAATLRGIVSDDFNGDEAIDIAVAAPMDSKTFIYLNDGNGSFEEPKALRTFQFARDLETGDFDGDGKRDLLVAGSSRGIVQYKGDGEGTFNEVGAMSELRPQWASGTRPVYSMVTFRAPGETRDSLIATHAYDRGLMTFKPNEENLLKHEHGIFIDRWVYGLEMAPISTPADSGKPDLVMVSRDHGVVNVHELEDPSVIDGKFKIDPKLEMAIPGGPRDIAIIDLDKDGWNDMVVVVRCLDLVLVYQNEGGFLIPSTELPVGRSPRQIVQSDFNSDGNTDFAVINRVSSDVSIASGLPGKAGLGGSSLIYPVDGEVADLIVSDVNDDGRDDVIQVHRSSSDFSVRYAEEGGALREPVYYPMGTLPNGQKLVDVNNDGIKDLVVATLGRSGISQGTVTIRFASAEGEFSEQRQVNIPAEVGGRMFGVDVADFDQDGNVDIVTGFFDCRIGFFRGNGDGTFEFTNVHRFLYEPRGLSAADFDNDGDIDVACASYTGDVNVVTNVSGLLDEKELDITLYPTPSKGKFGTQTLRIMDINADDDPDLILGSGDGVMVYLGHTGMQFIRSTQALPGTEFPASSLVSADFDGNGINDMAVACQILSCIVVLTADEGGKMVPALSVDVPSGRLLASGDLDGDGFADLVGSGAVLWTALSTRSGDIAPIPSKGERVSEPGPVINELLAINNRYTLPNSLGRRPDWVEIYNGASEAVDMSGWILTRMKIYNPEGNPTREYKFPAGSIIEPGGYQVVVLAKTLRDEFHTGFRLPGRGGLLHLFDAQGRERDRVPFGPQEPNISYARFNDGARGFAFNNFPSPGRENIDNGPVPPRFRLTRIQSAVTGVDFLEIPAPNEPIRLFGEGSDDEGIVNVTVVYQRMDIPDDELKRVILYDDGLHGDGEMQDGLFSGVIEEGLPEGASIRYQLAVQDLSDNLTTFPNPAAPSTLTGNVGFYTLAMHEGDSTLQISEVVAKNEEGLRDELGGTPDWVEIRNCGDRAISLDGVLLGDGFPSSDRWMPLPRNKQLAPGEFLVVYCDNDREQGPLHSGFTLPDTGRQIVLARAMGNGAHSILDIVDYGKLDPDTSYARTGCWGDWKISKPTPGKTNAIFAGDVDMSGSVNLSDVIVSLLYLYKGTPIPCYGAGDVNSDQVLDISDAVYMLNYLFMGGAELQDSALSCETPEV